MSVRPVAQLGQPVLRALAEPVTPSQDLSQLFEDLQDTVEATDGLGLAAPQINVSTRVIIVRLESGLTLMVNPLITAATGQSVAEEGCLSMPGLFAVIARPDQVELSYIDALGQKQQQAFSGLSARIIQHEVDHLDGVLFLDRLHPIKRSQLLKKWKILSRRARHTP